MTPVIYPVEILPTFVRSWLVPANPLHHLVSLFRTPLIEGRLPDRGSALLAVTVALAALALGWTVFTARSDDIVKRL